MDRNGFEENFRKKVCGEIHLVPEGVNRFFVHTPFKFDDGDHLKIILKQENGNWIFTDEGHTYMHLSYSDLKLDTDTRKKIIDTELTRFQILDRSGELILHTQNEAYGDALYSFIQGLLNVFDVRYLKREIVRSLFMEDFQTFLNRKLQSERIIFNYHHPTFDPRGSYPVDCYVEGKDRPIFIFGILNDDKCREATITILFYEKNSYDFSSIAIFENAEEITSKNLMRFMDLCGKEYSTLQSAEGRFDAHFATLSTNA